MSGGRPELRIADPATHPKRYVGLRVAAAYLEINLKTLDVFLVDGRLSFVVFGRRRRILVTELVAFERRSRVARRGAAHAEVPTR